MKIEIQNLTEDEILFLLEYRDKNNQTKEKNIFKKYIFNKYFLFDLKQSFVRETVRAIFLLYIIDYFKNN